MAIDVPRSGDTVLTTNERWAPAMMVLAPFINGGVEWLRAHLHYTVLEPNFASVLQTAVAIYVPLYFARRRMRQIREEEQIAAVNARTAAWDHGTPSGDGS